MEQLRIEVIDRAYAAILAAKTPAERDSMIEDCNRTARVFLEAGERMRHPEWSGKAVSLAVSKRILDCDGVDRAEVESWAMKLGYLEIWRQILAKVDAPDAPPGPGNP